MKLKHLMAVMGPQITFQLRTKSGTLLTMPSCTKHQRAWFFEEYGKCKVLEIEQNKIEGSCLLITI